MAIGADALGVRLDVRTPGDIAVDAIDLLASRMPEWIPRNGAPEVVLLEALATVAGGIVSTADVAIGTAVEAILDLQGVSRLPGSPATGAVTVTFAAPASLTIPAGTQFSLRDFGLALSATADVVVSGTSASVPVATDLATSAANGLGSSAVVDLLDAVEGAVSVAVSGTLAGGADEEGDAEFLVRNQALEPQRIIGCLACRRRW